MRPAALCLLLVLTGCAGPKAAPPARGPVPVTAAAAAQKDVPIQLRVIGNVQPITSVAVRSLVGGELTGVFFQEGQDAKKDSELFQIDPRPYQETVRQIEANLARDEALAKQAEAMLARDSFQAKNAESDFRRYTDLVKQGVVSQQLADQYRTTYEALDAQLRADRASLENAQAAAKADRATLEKARLDLSYCSIHAPLDGRTGSLLIQKGNVVKANDTVLVTLNQIQPIYVSFAVPEQNLAEIKKNMTAGKLRVNAVIPQEEQRPEAGLLTFVDNAVDTTTGTIRLKATFANAERRLWPGQFVNVLLTLGSQPNAIVVPSQAVQTGQQGPYVYVIKADQTAESRAVTPGLTVAGETVIEKGVQAGEQVVTDGHLRLVPGDKVLVKGGAGRPSPRPGAEP